MTTPLHLNILAKPMKLLQIRPLVDITMIMTTITVMKIIITTTMITMIMTTIIMSITTSHITRQKRQNLF